MSYHGTTSDGLLIQQVEPLGLFVSASEHEFMIARLQAKIAKLTLAAQDFIDKVDRGEARSVDSYNKFKQALS